jgi:two-component system sensor kinase
MISKHKELYAAALQEYLSGAGEVALGHAYELGRKAIQNGLGIMEIISIHKAELLKILSRTSKLEDLIRIVESGQNILIECLAPFELTYRGFKDVEIANRDLESFSYSVSHDLQAPLRAIDGFSMMLVRDLKHKLAEDEIRKLNVIRENARKMTQLINDLLAFSRLGCSAMSVVNLDIENLIKEVWSEQLSINPGRNMKLSLGQLPKAAGDRTLIREVFANLISNAVKFTRSRDCSIIEIGGNTDEDESIFYIKDNGVGFQMKYYEKLFKVFQRLHSSSQFEGTGVGLAMVQRIIQRHGGRVWAEGKPGEGAIFYFTLKRA